MSTSLRAAARTGLVGGAALLAAALMVPSASAASAELSYSCDYGVGETTDSGDATASFDSGIGEGLVVEVGDEVSIDPFTGDVTTPEGFADALRDDNIAEIEGSGLMLTLIDETGDPYVVDLTFATTPVPGEGPLVLHVTGTGDPIIAAEGTNTLVADVFYLFTGTDEDEPELELVCELTDEGDTAIDAFEATAAATPTVTVTASASATPTRPAVVQTDFADDEESSALPLALGGGLLAGAGALLARHGHARAASRRH